jgi:hypothetical protein
MPRPSTDLVRAQLFPRRRWNAKAAGAILRSLEGSGLSVLEFAARHGLNPQRLYRWRGQLATEPPVTAHPFVEIKRASGEEIEVVLRSGHVVRVKDGFGEDTLRRVVAVLEAPVAAC